VDGSPVLDVNGAQRDIRHRVIRLTHCWPRQESVPEARRLADPLSCCSQLAASFATAPDDRSDEDRTWSGGMCRRITWPSTFPQERQARRSAALMGSARSRRRQKFSVRLGSARRPACLFRGFGGKRLPLTVISRSYPQLGGNVRQSGKRFALHCQQQADSAARSRLGQDQQAP
jgi:hypothetical protein